MSDNKDGVKEAKQAAEAIDEIGAERLSNVLTGVFSEAVKAEQRDEKE